MSRLLILGQSDQLAKALAEVAHGAFKFVECAGRARGCMALPREVSRLIAALGRTAIISAAAWMAVDTALTDEDAALQVNAHAAGEAAGLRLNTKHALCMCLRTMCSGEMAEPGLSAKPPILTPKSCVQAGCFPDGAPIFQVPYAAWRKPIMSCALLRVS